MKMTSTVNNRRHLFVGSKFDPDGDLKVELGHDDGGAQGAYFTREDVQRLHEHLGRVLAGETC